MKVFKRYVIIICISLLLLLLYVSYITNLEENMETDIYNNRTIEIIVSRYNEDLEWLNDKLIEGLPVTIYNKGKNDDFNKIPLLKKQITLDNVGVCVHTYLYYIIENYENLPDVTIFLPGSCMDDHKKELTTKTIIKTKETKNSVFYVAGIHTNPISEELYDFTIDNYSLDNQKNKSVNSDTLLIPCDIRPFGKWYKTVFPNLDVNYVNYKGIFSVSKEHILNRSKKSYEELIKFVNKNKNEESAHYFERAFLAVFHPIPQKCIFF